MSLCHQGIVDVHEPHSAADGEGQRRLLQDVERVCSAHHHPSQHQTAQTLEGAGPEDEQETAQQLDHAHCEHVLRRLNAISEPDQRKRLGEVIEVLQLKYNISSLKNHPYKEALELRL